MYIRSPNTCFELIAKVRYFFLRHVKKVELISHIEYRHRRWYQLDEHCKVIKVARTYFEVMQPS